MPPLATLAPNPPAAPIKLPHIHSGLVGIVGRRYALAQRTQRA